MDSSRFASYNLNDEQELSVKKNAKSTDSSTIFALKVFTSFCREIDVENGIPVEHLPEILKKFYMCMRNEKGDYYKLSSMRSLRFSLQRHFLSLHQVDIIHDIRFAEANVVFANMLRKI